MQRLVSPCPILVLSQSRLCLHGPVICVVELAARIAGLCRRCRQRAKRCNGLLSALSDKTEDADACRLSCSACVANAGSVAPHLTTGVVCVSAVYKSAVSAARCTQCGCARRCSRDRVCTTATTDGLYDKLWNRLALASALLVACGLPPPPLPHLALSHTPCLASCLSYLLFVVHTHTRALLCFACTVDVR
jgi:hypothetical protein